MLLLTIVNYFIGLSCLYYLVRAIILKHSIAYLLPISAAPTTTKVSFVIPIHNEGKKLKAALSSVLQLNNSHYEVIAVDDRSNDNSAEILAQLASQYPHLKVLRVTELPKGWLGKTHAMQRGSEQAQGDYIIFTDADVHYHADSLAAIIQYVTQHQLEHLTLAPKLVIKTLSLKILMPFLIFSLFTSLKPWLATKANSKHAIGIGAFNLISQQAFKKIGGFEKLRLDPIDDVGLAKLVKQQQLPQAYANGEQLLSITWFDDLKQTMCGLEKNIFAQFDYSLIKALFALGSLLVFILMPFMLMILKGFSLTAVGCYLLILLSMLFFTQQLQIPWYFALFYPVAASIMLFIASRAVLLSSKRQGIIWGGQFFSIKRLKHFKKSGKHEI